MTLNAVDDLLSAASELRAGAWAVRGDLGLRAAHVYNPLEYAWTVHAAFVERFGGTQGRDAILVGMNPGPWGMVQTGVPFGDPVVVREWMGLSGDVGEPPAAEMHPSRPVIGLDSKRREVSGQRLYGLARDEFGGLDSFFERLWVVNYCPLAIFDDRGANVTPVQLSAAERALVAGPCDRHLATVISILRPAFVVGVGTYAFGRVSALLDGAPGSPRAGVIPHPSPASPRANRGWADETLASLVAMGIEPGVR